MNVLLLFDVESIGHIAEFSMDGVDGYCDDTVLSMQINLLMTWLLDFISLHPG